MSDRDRPVQGRLAQVRKMCNGSDREARSQIANTSTLTKDNFSPRPEMQGRASVPSGVATTISGDFPRPLDPNVMSFAVDEHRPSNSVLLLVAVSVGVAVVQLIFGVRVVGGYTAAHDGPFAIASFVQFKDEFLSGHIPRWSISGFSGLGSPIFYFYPPGVYSVATLLAVFLPGVSAATIIGVAEVLLRVAAIVTCFLWLRQRVTADAALLGGSLYALMPWVSVVNPQARLAFAECGATVLLPLAFLAVDVQRSRPVGTIVSLAIVICALTFTHLPTLVATGGLLVIYGALLNDTWRGRLRSIAGICGGIVLGLGMAACYLLPALGLLDAISSFALWDHEHQPEQHFILAANTFNMRFGLLVNAGVMAPLLMVVVFCGAAIIKGRVPMALVGTFGIAVFLAVPLSAPIWAILTPLRLIQFPGRFLVPASLFASSLVAIVVPSQGPTFRRCALHRRIPIGRRRDRVQHLLRRRHEFRRETNARGARVSAIRCARIRSGGGNCTRLARFYPARWERSGARRRVRIPLRSAPSAVGPTDR